MSFFDVPLPPRPDPEPIVDQPEWAGPPHGVMSYWLWPLPPEGDLTFVASWPLHAIAESTATIDAGELHERATEAQVIWPT